MPAKVGPCGRTKKGGCKCPVKGGSKKSKDVVIDGGLKEVKAHPLSDAEIKHILGDDIKILTYDDLKGLRHIDEMFDNKGRSILLYTPFSPTEGHWTCLIRRPDSIEFFDSYGELPDNEDDLNGQPPILTKLMKQSGLPVFFNTKQFQKDKEDIATCGKWCCARLLYKDKSIDQFNKVVEKFDGPTDDFVSGLIYSFIKV